MRLTRHLAAILFTLIAPAVSSAAAGACAVPAGGGTIETMGSWVVNGDQTVEDRTIHLNGPLQITKGKLTLRNVALEIDSAQFAASSRGTVAAIQIDQDSGGSLAISASSIRATSAPTGLIETVGKLGNSAATVSIDRTCLTHVGLSLSDLGPVTVSQNELLYAVQESFGGTISLTRTSHAAVNDNVIRGQDGVTPPGVTGIGLSYVHDSEILRNTVLWTATGVGLASSWNNHVAENTWLGAGQSAGFNGLAANWWAFAIIGRAGMGGMGLSDRADNNLIEKNTLMGAHSAMLTIVDSSNNRVSQNTIAGSGYGFTVRGGSGNAIDGNEIRDVSDDGIQVFRSHDNLFTNNRIYNSGRGISLYASEKNTLGSNTIADTDRGIFLHESAGNVLSGNTISSAFAGIFAVSNSSGNTVTGNNVVTTDQPAWDDGSANIWKGNFWGKAGAAKWVIGPGAANDGTPAAAMLAPTPTAVPAFAPPAFSGPVERFIEIKGQEVWQDARTVNGAIAIDPGASLTLRGATLTYTMSGNPRSIRIYVSSGGSLTIEDSKIIGPRWDQTFYIQVQQGATFSMKRSEIDNAGDWIGQSAAVSTFADNTVIEDSTFVNVYCAVSAEGVVRGLRFVNNTVTGAVKAIGLGPGTEDGAVVTGNRVSRYGMWGFDFNATWAFSAAAVAPSHLTDNVFSDGWGEAMHIQADASTLEIARNTCSSVKGPCRVTGTGGVDIDELRLLSSSPSAAEPGESLAAVVRFGGGMSALGMVYTENRLYTAALLSNGSPLQDRSVALSFGSLTRLPLAASAVTAAPYDLTVGFETRDRIAVSKPEIRFAVQPGSTPPPQVFRTVYRPWSNEKWRWTATSDSSWLHVTPGSGVGASELTVTADAKSFAPGVYTGKIQVATAGSVPQFVDVTLTVTGDLPIVVANPSTLSFGGTSGDAKTVSLTLAQAAFPLSFAVAVRTDMGGNWLSATANTNNTPAALTVSVNPAILGAGEYMGEVTISSAGTGNGPLSIPVTLTVGPAGTAVRVTSVVNGASFDTAIAPESWVTITGVNLSRTTRAWGDGDIVQGRLPTSLDGVRVTINNRPAFVYFVSPTQLNVLTSLFSGPDSDPFAATVEVEAPDGTVETTALMRRIAPGVFVFGGQNAAALHMDGLLVCAANSIAGGSCRAANTGETIQLYVTGLGTNLSPKPPDGMILIGASTVNEKVSVTLGGSPCAVLYAGLVAPGLYQINLVVPDIPSGDQSLVVSAGGATGPAGPILTIAGRPGSASH
jgi:uncharacterized protein (TIGR03437 family)